MAFSATPSRQLVNRGRLPLSAAFCLVSHLALLNPLIALYNLRIARAGNSTLCPVPDLNGDSSGNIGVGKANLEGQEDRVAMAKKKRRGAKILGKYAAPRLKRPRSSPIPPRGKDASGWLSFRSPQSILSAFSHSSLLSFASILSIGSAGSILSIGSLGSILSIGSTGSILSIGSIGSILSIGSAGKGLRKETTEAETEPLPEPPPPPEEPVMGAPMP